MSKSVARINMTEGPLLPILVRVALPVAFSYMLQSTYDIVNAYWIGRLGGNAIAAVTASIPIVGVLVSLGAGLATAGATLVAQNMGAGKAERVDHVAAQTIVVVAALALSFGLLGILGTDALLDLVGVGDDVSSLARDYLTVRYLGLLPMFVFIVMQAMLQAAGEVRFAMHVQVGSVVFNALLDPCLMFGFGPLPELGIKGAAAATVIAQTAALVIVLIHLLSGHSALHLRLWHFRPDLGAIRRNLALGLPVSVEQAIRTFSSLLIMAFAAHFGTTGLAAYGIGVRLLGFWMMPIIGLSVATAVVVGQNIGAGQWHRVHAASRVAAWLGFVTFTMIGLAHIPFVPAIMSALAPGETEVIASASEFAYIFLPFLGIMAVPQVLLGTFRGAGSTRQSMTISIIMQWVFQLPAAVLLTLASPLGLLGIWWSYPVAGVATAILCIAWFRSDRWQRRLVRD
jgi:putative MATE family efflux protein